MTRQKIGLRFEASQIRGYQISDRSSIEGMVWRKSRKIETEELGAGGRFECLIAGGVVGMTVSVDDVSYPVLPPLGLGQDAICVEGRID